MHEAAVPDLMANPLKYFREMPNRSKDGGEGVCFQATKNRTGTIMVIDDLVKWGTFGGAIIAGLTGLYTLYLKHRDENQRLRVGLGPIHARISPATEMYAINHGMRKVELADYGFIQDRGQLFSAPIEAELEPQAWGGKPSFSLEHLEHLCVGFEGYRNVEVIGAYAMSATNRKLWITFSKEVSLWKKVWLWFYIQWNRYQ